MNGHLSDRQLLDFIEGELSARKRERAVAHVQACPACRARLERMERTALALREALQAAGQQSPRTSPPDVARSWREIARRREKPRAPAFAPALRAALRYAAAAVALILCLNGLLYVLRVTRPYPAEPTPQETPFPAPTQAIVPGPPLTPGPLPRPQPANRPATVSILLLGVDGEQDEIDALMLLHLNRESGRAFLLSIPRDLYVEVAGRGFARLGDLYALGNGLDRPREAVSATLGLPVDHVILFHFEGFTTLVDAIGGVDVDAPAAIDDPLFPDGRGGYDPFRLPAGAQHLDGDTALRYARTLVVPAPGFDRAFRQRQIALAMHDRVTRLDLLPDLISRSPALWMALRGSVETDLSLDAAIDLLLEAERVAGGDIVHAALGEECTVPYTTPAGRQVFLPKPDKIESLMETLLEE